MPLTFDAGYKLYFSTISLYLRATRRALFSFVNRNLVRAKLRRSSQDNMDGSFFFLTRSYSCLLTGGHFEQRRLELPPAVISHFIFLVNEMGQENTLVVVEIQYALYFMVWMLERLRCIHIFLIMLLSSH